MGYTKFTWSISTPITTFGLNHLESQYAEVNNDYNNHNHDSVYMPKSESDAKFWNDDFKTGSDADTLDGYHGDDLVGAAIPPGGIIAWESATPPTGYAICNGGNDTPDLRDYFQPCVKAAWAEDYTFGINSLTLTAAPTINTTAVSISQMARHNHSYSDSYNGGSGGGGSEANCTAGLADASGTSSSVGGGSGHGHPGSTISITNGSIDNAPLWYALYYIMKL